MKKIILLIAAVLGLGFCFGVPQAEAAGGAVAVIYVDAWSHPLYIAADDPLRQTTVEMFKKEFPPGYNIHCSYDVDYDADGYLYNEERAMWFSKAYGYDFVIKIRVIGVDKPQAIQFRHPRASFDFYEGGSSFHSAMYSFHATTQYLYNHGGSAVGNVGDSPEKVAKQAFLNTLKDDAEYWGEKARKILDAENPPEQTGPNDYFHRLLRDGTML